MAGADPGVGAAPNDAPDAVASPAPDPAATPAPGRPEFRAASTRRSEGPRRIRHGLKLRRRSEETLPWVAAEWKAALERTIPTLSRTEGLEYARLGQVVSLFIIPPTAIAPADASADTLRSAAGPTRIEAVVQGRSVRPYSVAIEIGSWTRERWEEAIDLMAREAIYSAKLLAGEFPSAVEELCRTLGSPLLPAPGEEFGFHCSCIHPQPCKHHAAALAILVDRLIDQPLLAFNLRGMPHELGMAKLQEARTLHTHGRSTAHGGGPARAQVKPFEACFDDFWRPGPQLAEFEQQASAEHVPHALLRRLGPSPLQGRFPLVGLLASIYDSIRSDAERLREGSDTRAIDPAPDGSSPSASSDSPTLDADTLDDLPSEPQ